MNEKGKNVLIGEKLNLSNFLLKILKKNYQQENLTPKGKSVNKLLQLVLYLIKNETSKKRYSEFILRGGHELSNIESSFAYVAPRIIKHENVKFWYEKIEKITESDLKVTYNPKKVEGDAIGPIYSYDETWNYLMLHFNGLKKFLENTSKNNNGIIIYLT